MPTNKNAQLRYQILDRCFSDFLHKYTIDDLIDKVNEALMDISGSQVSIRQIREDIKYMKDRVTYNAPIEAYPYEGRKCYYRYSDKNFSIFNNELSTEEVTSLRSTIDILSRFRGIPTNAWLEDVISNLEFRFGVRPNPENVVAFEQNEMQKGTEFLGELINSAINHQPLNIVYRTFTGNESTNIIHPYHIKQFNNRWFLIGLQEGEHANYITNKALDRIVKFTHANVPFIPNTEINFNDYFKDIIGVTLPKEHPEPEEIILQFDAARFPYITSKPIHASQIVEDEEKHIIKLKVRPNKELEARIFSFGKSGNCTQAYVVKETNDRKIRRYIEKVFYYAERLQYRAITLQTKIMIKDADISENQLLVSYGEKVCMNLLKDHTTQQNIYWATDSYSDLGNDYTFFAPITLDKITSYISDDGIVITKEKYKELVKENPEVKEKYQEIIRPRSVKSREEQTQRAKDKAEVFTPAWICNAQNNLIDEAWFGRKEGLFNSPDPNDPHKWINNEEKIIFPEDKTWKDYVADMRLEITCGEAPYLCNRYDAVSGEYNDDVKHRIGLLDRKLRIVSENTKNSKEWILWAKIALRSTYGFEWQGDNLLLAREALFFTFEEHYIAQFGEKKFNQNKMRMMPGVAYIISWNIWQMDGLKFGLPGYDPYIEKEPSTGKQLSISFDDVQEEKHEPDPHERLCLVKDFLEGINLQKATLNSKDFHDLKAPKCTFESLVNKNN